MFLTTTLTYTYFSYDFLRQGFNPSQESNVLPDFKVTIYPDWFHTARLTWIANPDWVNPQYNVYRGESKGSEYTKLNAAPISTAYFNDLGTQKTSKYAEEYYIVEVLIDGQAIGRSEPIWPHRKLPTWHQLRANEMNRREWILLSRFTGQDCLLLKSLEYGKYAFHCPECWDDRTQTVTKDYCKTCYGTAYKGGYHSGIPTYIQFESFAKQDILNEESYQEPATVECWTIAYPIVDARDLIIRKSDFTVWAVDSVNDSEMLGNTVRQIMRVNLLRKTMVQYELLKREGVLP